MNNLITIENKIYTIRDKQVMLDEELAKLYQVETRVFNQAVKRNIKRFPQSFRFQLSEDEYQNLTSQFVTSSLSSLFVPPFSWECLRKLHRLKHILPRNRGNESEDSTIRNFRIVQKDGKREVLLYNLDSKLERNLII